MATTLTSPRSLEEFLALPEEKPALEFFDERIYQKPMPKGKHSKLQAELIARVNEIAEASRIAFAFPELRCTFAGRSIVPDIVVLRWSSIPIDENGEPREDVLVPPDWMIEILSPNQNSGLVIRKILFSLEQGGQLGWLIDLSDRSVVAFFPNRLPKSLQGSDPLPVLSGIPWQISAEQLFDWLKMNV